MDPAASTAITGASAAPDRLMLTHAFSHSSALSSARYNPDTRQLDVTFVSGRTYSHEGVPVEVYEGLVGADSPGRYYAQAVKGTY